MEIKNIIDIIKKLKDDLILFITNNLNYRMSRENPDGIGSLSMNRLEGSTTGEYSSTLGHNTIASGEAAHAEGGSIDPIYNEPIPSQSWHFSQKNPVEINVDVTVYGTEAKGYASHAEGVVTAAVGGASHSEGCQTLAYDDYSHAEGDRTIAVGVASHAEGTLSMAIRHGAHAEGVSTKANGVAAHAEGCQTIADSQSAHAEGEGTEATSMCAHAEGYHSKADGHSSHAEGYYTEASGMGAHAEGYKTIASGGQHVEGRYNLVDEDLKYLHIVGNGEQDYDTGVVTRSNAYTLDEEGNGWYAGKVEATNGVKIGNAVLTYDSTLKALKIDFVS